MSASSETSTHPIEIQSSTGSYQVHLKSHSFEESLRHPNASILADAFFTEHLAALNIPATFIQATEENKSLDATPTLIEALRKAGVNRQTELVAVGGGIVQDLSAFIASIYMRGLTWTYVPSTLLAMVDSCIGGKSSINVGPYKNLVGTFHPPKQVFIDPALAQTLSDDQKASGLIEAAKICFCRGAEAFDRHMAFQPSVAMAFIDLEGLIRNSLESKQWFIEIDEFDKNERLLLNFGHTFGHAIEGATHFAISHGVAVGLGILCALAFERATGTDYSNCPRIQILETHLDEMVSTLPNVAAHLNSMSMDDFFERFASDKKHSPDHFALILVDQSGQVVLRQIPKTVERVQSIKQAVESVVERFRR